jgi:hypothetical protein
MPRKIQRKPIRHRLERRDNEPTISNQLSIQEAITVLGGITGIIVAILWLGGRFYADGYFSAMNIPSYQINFSIWEYAETSWMRLIFYFLEKIYAPLVLLATIFLAIFLSTAILQHIFPKLKIVDALKNLESEINKLRKSYRPIFVFSLSSYFIYLMLLAFLDINASGYAVGRSSVLTKSYSIEVYSKSTLPLGAGHVVPNVPSTLIKYHGLHLLTYNNGKYYLFRDIDPITCKPIQVFIVADSQDTYFVLGSV